LEAVLQEQRVICGYQQSRLGYWLPEAIKLLLYADDLALMSETPQGWQKQIDVLSEFCVERQLVINVSKTKVVVFEKCCSAAP